MNGYIDYVGIKLWNLKYPLYFSQDMVPSRGVYLKNRDNKWGKKANEFLSGP